MTNSDNERTSQRLILDGIEAVAAGSLAHTMGIVVTEASTSRVVARMPVERNRQPYGLLHGGASAVLAETVGSIGSALHAGIDTRIAVGIELNCTHHRSVSEGEVTAIAIPVSLGRTLATWEIAITDDQNTRICTARLTCLLRDKPPATRPTPDQPFPPR